MARLLGTTRLTAQQWGVAVVAALALLVAWEIGKAVARRAAGRLSTSQVAAPTVVPTA